MDISVLIFSALAMAAGCFVQSSIGFGMAIVAAPVVFMFEPRFVPGTLIFISFLLSLFNTWQHRKSISYKGLGSAFVGRVPGTFVAGWLMVWMTSAQLSLLLGGGVLLAVVVSFAKIHIEPTSKNLFIAGFLSGVMGTATAIGGPPMAIVMQNAKANNMRANLSAYFLFSCVLSMIALYTTGHFGWWHVKHALFMLPPCFLAIWLSVKVQHLIRPEWMRGTILVLCSISGVTALYQGLA
ncbi:sulfite exporter TauE/SafE family protein [Thaumasiovibrio sp. DFM-14]|uniref:sulfite exporter TauE/SafE family protein n=1 Tax=Thaumasiovibrio sp. DFM-14 TaxID=3384792 RepID=UPI0039A14A97